MLLSREHLGPSHRAADERSARAGDTVPGSRCDCRRGPERTLASADGLMRPMTERQWACDSSKELCFLLPCVAVPPRGTAYGAAQDFALPCVSSCSESAAVNVGTGGDHDVLEAPVGDHR